MKYLIAIIALFALSGCFTMHIQNENKDRGRTAEEWHHDFVFGLAEISEPVNLSNRCPGGWNQVVIEETFIQGFVQAVTWNLYNPKNVKYTCVKTQKPKPSASSVEIPIEIGIPKRHV